MYLGRSAAGVIPTPQLTIVLVPTHTTQADHHMKTYFTEPEYQTAYSLGKTEQTLTHMSQNIASRE